MRRLNRQIWGWALYDWANSAFAVSVFAIVLPFYFAGTLATSGMDPDGNLIEGVTLFGAAIPGGTLWGWTVSLSMVFVVLLTPLVGAIADYAGKKKSFLVSQSASRTIYARMIPRDQAAEFFSLYAIVGKAASVFGPALFAWGMLFSARLEGVPVINSMALAVLPLFLMVLAGLLLLLRVDVEKGRQQVKAEDAHS